MYWRTSQNNRGIKAGLHKLKSIPDGSQLFMLNLVDDPSLRKFNWQCDMSFSSVLTLTSVDDETQIILFPLKSSIIKRENGIW